MPTDGDKLWSIAIFELFNMRNDFDFKALDESSELRKLSEREHFKRTAQFEYAVLSEICWFYNNYWTPHCKKLSLVSHKDNWCEDNKDGFEQWFKSLPSDSPYLRHYLGR